MGDESGSNPTPEKERSSVSPSGDATARDTPPRPILLLVEDNLPDALLVREVIRMEDLAVDIHDASDGQEAIDFIARAERSEDALAPNILLLDLNLPKVDGFEVLRRLRASEKFKGIPVLVLSSSDSPGDRKRAAELGAGYFRKPPSYDEFLKLGGVLKQMLR